MSRSHRSSTDDLAYGDIPQRWDRDRFERFGRGGPPPSRFEEDYRFSERDRPGRREITVADRVEERGPGGRFEERERFWEDDRYNNSRPRRRTDRELFGDVDPRELAGMALTPYRRAPSRPGLIRRQSSLDTFDRRPMRYEREEYRMPPYQPIPLPIRRSDRYRDAYDEPEDYREVEIRRERSVHRRGPPKSRSRSDARSEAARTEAVSVKSTKSKAKTRATSTSSSSSSSESVTEITKEESVRESIVDVGRKFKRGKTRMPKRLVRREAIMDLAYPFDEEEDFFVLRVALEKEQIDEVIKVSESYMSQVKEEKTVIRVEEPEEEPAPVQEREEIIRTEWINPPSIGGRSRRSRSARPPSPSAFSITTRRTSPARTRASHSRARSRGQSTSEAFVEERRTVIETVPAPIPPPGPPPPEFFEERRAIIEERPAPTFPPSGALIIKEREHRSDRDIHAEIRALESERRSLRLEREADGRREVALRLRERSDNDFPLLMYREARPIFVENIERERSPPRNVIRVEKDRKVRKGPNPKKVALAMATLL